MRRIFHKDEYFARLWYEENRNRKSPRIWTIAPIPTPFVWKDGTVDYLVVTQDMHSVSRYKHSGEPRYSEWGADISEVKVEVSVFNREYLCWWYDDPYSVYKLPVYIQNFSGLDVRRKAQAVVIRNLLRFYRK